MPTRRRFAGAQRARMAPIRRKRVWARTRHTILDQTTNASLESLLADYRTDAGLTRNPPGVTVGGIRGRIAWEPSAYAAGQIDELAVGIVVAPDTVEAVDLDPAAFLHLDWMLYERFAFGGAAGAHVNEFVVNVRSQRKMEELNEDLFVVFTPAMGTPRTLDVTTQFSTLLILP